MNVQLGECDKLTQPVRNGQGVQASDTTGDLKEMCTLGLDTLSKSIFKQNKSYSIFAIFEAKYDNYR